VERCVIGITTSVAQPVNLPGVVVVEELTMGPMRHPLPINLQNWRFQRVGLNGLHQNLKRLLGESIIEAFWVVQ